VACDSWARDGARAGAEAANAWAISVLATYGHLSDVRFSRPASLSQSASLIATMAQRKITVIGALRQTKWVMMDGVLMDAGALRAVGGFSGMPGD